jgi:glycosyltransferase involved in cell wall biosynthesis
VTVPSNYRVSLFLPDLSGGGAERVTLDLATGLLQAGADVDLVVGSLRGPLTTSVPDGVRVVDLGVARIARALGPLRRYLRSVRPDALVAGLTHANVLAVLAARSVRPRVRVVVVHHNTLSMSVQHAPAAADRAAPLLVRVAYPLADRVVAVSAGVADDLATRAHLPRERIDVVYNPMVFDRLRSAGDAPPPHAWLADDGLRVVLAVGRLHEQKDFPTLIRAMSLLPDDHRLLILGDGAERGPLSALIERLDLGERVDLVGFVPNPYPFFRHADVFVLSSRWEGLPTVLVEALAFPVALVATDCPSGPAEILADGRWGTLVPVGDERAIASAVLATGSSERGRPPEALSPYDLRHVTQQYLEVISGVPGTSSAPNQGAPR